VNWLGHKQLTLLRNQCALCCRQYRIDRLSDRLYHHREIPGNPPPPWLIIPLDHSIFIGVMTNAIFGLINDATQERRSLWPWAEDVLFWA